MPMIANSMPSSGRCASESTPVKSAVVTAVRPRPTSILDPDVVIGELAVSRYIEQSRAGTLRPIRNDPGLGMLVASVDLSYHRWHRGRANVQVACGIDRIGNTSFALAGAAAVGDERLATARSTMVLIDRARHRPTPIDATLRASMEGLFITADEQDIARDG